MNKVRWYIEVSKKGENNWVKREDLMYSGWFHSSGSDKPTQVVLSEYDRAVERYPWLDIRLIQENWGMVKTVVHLVS